MDTHDKAVARISVDVRKFWERQEPFRIYHGSTNSTRKSQYERDKIIDTFMLNNVLKVDTESKTVLTEPNVALDELVEATLQHGLIPPVVMEFPGITVGGGFAGTSAESSSFRYGVFDRTVNWIEMVTGDGQVVRASKNENEDLLYGAASAFGTLGVTTLLELQLIDAKSYVDLTYHPVTSISHALKVMEEATQDSTVEYLDAIMFSAKHGVVCSGRLTNDVRDHRIQGFAKRSDPWFYLHVERLMKNSSTSKSETIPIVDYLFRYDRGGFWVAKYAYKYFLTPFNRITRFILDYYMHARVMYLALHKSDLSSQCIIQDVAIPPPRASEFMDYLDQEFKKYPIWLCPLKQSGTSTHTLKMQQKTNKEYPDLMLNFGVWGPGPKKREEFVKRNRELEAKVHELGGQKCLYARTYYTEDEFNEIYNRHEYDDLRKKYHASYLPTVYDKVKMDDTKNQKDGRRWMVRPLAGFYGVWKAYRGGDYLLPKKKGDEY